MLLRRKMAPEAGRPEGGSEIVRREVMVVWIMSSVIHPSLVTTLWEVKQGVGERWDVRKTCSKTTLSPLPIHHVPLTDLYTLTHLPIPVSEA
jgi:hypothetical protein